MKPLPRFLYIPPGESNTGLILLTKEPFYLAEIVKLPPGNDMAAYDYVNEHKPLATGEVTGYSIILCFAGQLKGNFLRVNSPEWEQDLQNLFSDMAHWYLIEVINKNLKYYKKYEITT